MKKSEKKISDGKKNQAILLIAMAGLMAMILFTYRDAPGNQFVDWDDFTYVVDNKLVREKGDNLLKELFTTPVASNFHPLTMLSLRLNNNECTECPEGISPEPFIKWNIFLHMLNTILVFFLVRSLAKGKISPAFLTAAIFAVHPMHVESVAWISERKEVLNTFFFFSGILAWIRMRLTGKSLWYIIAFLLFVCAVLSKATAVVLPVLFMLIDYWLDDNAKQDDGLIASLRKFFTRKYLLKLIPFFIVSLAAGLIAYRIQNGQNFLGIFNEGTGTPDVVNQTGPFSLWQKITISGYGFITYLLRFFYPADLVALNPYPLMADFVSFPFSLIRTIAVLLAALILAAALWSSRRTRIWVFGTGFYLITIALVLQFISVGMAITANRYSYIPYVGIGFMLTYATSLANKPLRSWLLAAWAGFIISMIFVSQAQVSTWKDTETLWSNVIEKYPDEELPRRSRGKYYSRIFLSSSDIRTRERYAGLAMDDFNVAIKAGSTHSDVYDGAGVILATGKKNNEALNMLNRAISLDPEKGSAFYNRALVYEALGKKDEAIDDYDMALRFRPEKALEIINNRSNLLLESGRFGEAARDLDYLITRNRSNPVYYFNRGVARVQTGDITGAAEDFKRVLELDPSDSIAREQLNKIQNKTNQ